MARLDTERQSELEPKRVEYVRSVLIDLGYEVVFGKTKTELKFTHNGHTIIIFPYSGWFSGKGIGSGRGINNLLAKLKSQ